MKSCRFALAFCAVALIGTLAADSASAQDGFGGYGRYGYSRFGYNRGYVHANHAAPPYFALNPPVYYGKVRPRDYGWSPFPYGPSGHAGYSARRPAVAASTERWAMTRGNEERIRNPYIDAEPAVDTESASPSDAKVEEAKVEEAKVEEATTGIIRNPYVDQPSRVATRR